MKAVREVKLDSWTCFLELARSEFAKAPALIFRGQTHYDWPIKSSLHRHVERYPQRKNLCGGIPEYFSGPPLTEQDHLKAFRRAICGRRGENPSPLEDDDCWALGQHHGLATPLLDFTRSPFVALFFAFEEEECYLSKEKSWGEPKYRGVFALTTSALDTQGRAAAKFISPLTDANPRLNSQLGLFVKLPWKTDLEEYVTRKHKGRCREAILTKYKIPNDGRDECLIMLNKMNINNMTLFPDIAGAARHVNGLWRPGFEDSIAYV